MRLGIATIYQELDLVEHLSVAENVFLGHEVATGGFVRSGEARARTAALLARLGHPEIAPGALVGSLSAAGQQIASMARALSHDVRLIVMDEPSAALDPDEVDNLFRIVADLTADGRRRRLHLAPAGGDPPDRRPGHRPQGRPGRRPRPGRPGHAHPRHRRPDDRPHRRARLPPPPATRRHPCHAPVLAVEGLAREGEFAPLDFALHPGEILGLAGLVGSGRSEILETVFGARRPTAGRVLVDGRPLRPGSVPAAVRAGLGLAPEERKSQALLLLESVNRNVSVSSLARFARAGWLNRTAEKAATRAATRDLSLRPDDPDRPVRTLSGGNQQKAVLARWLLRGCRVLLLDEPTRGVDVGARAELYAVIRRLADDGVAVLLVSSEIPEVLGLADRVLVLREGRVVHEGAGRSRWTNTGCWTWSWPVAGRRRRGAAREPVMTARHSRTSRTRADRPRAAPDCRRPVRAIRDPYGRPRRRRHCEEIRP